MNIYIDESVHPEPGFMLIAYVLCDADPEEELRSIVQRYGVTEFHACEKMDDNKAMQELRRELIQYVNSRCSWGVFVLPRDQRHNVAPDFKTLIASVSRTSRSSGASIFVDEGILTKKQVAELTREPTMNGLRLCTSQEIRGIQLADVVAALCGTRLKEEIMGLPKMLTYGDEAGFDPPIEAPLGYELWALLRYSMRRAPDPIGDEMPSMATFRTEGYGFVCGASCPETLRRTATRLFGEVYLGCIH